MTLGQICAIVGGSLRGNASIVVSGISTDTRSIVPGDLFCAIVGERVDPHELVHDAMRAGAVACLVSSAVDVPSVITAPALELDPVIIALGRIARIQREGRPNTNMIGITGSSGKTTTKDIIGQVLGSHGPTFAPSGSPNNELGLPLTILRAPETADYVVLEMGMRGLGHIAYLCGIAKPNVGVVTNVGKAHIGEVGSIEAIARAKAELIDAIPATGFAILNNDDDFVRAMRFDTQAHVVTYGLREGSDVRGENIDVNVDGTTTFDLVHGNNRHVIHLPMLGKHNVSNALAAAATGLCMGMSLMGIAEALEHVVVTSKWRMETYEAKNDIMLINDAYNANPESMSAALHTLAGFPRTRGSWAVLGKMHELGSESEAEHRKIGELVTELKIDHLVGIGDSVAPMIQAAQRAGHPHALLFSRFEVAAEYISTKAQREEIILFKASRSEGLEELAQMVAARLNEGASK